ncbi:MAG: hypothetical protein PF637_00915 [Spirochaetes bacterium]|nr:hypothetical protein [Spirochaetota bacterium]
MSTSENTLNITTLPNIIIETGLIAIAVALPVVMHLIPGVNVFALLPMHWTIFIAGLLYGWKGGLIAGLTAPAISFLLTGMPFPPVLPLMTLELAMFGSLTGLLREKTELNSHIIVFLASAAGRIGFLLLALMLGRTDNVIQFAANSFVPGIIAAIAIIACTPIISNMVKKRFS